jgi:hypothetical protein
MNPHEVIARQLAGVPIEPTLLDALPDPARRIAQRIANANGAGPQAAFEQALAETVADEHERASFRRRVFAVDPDEPAVVKSDTLPRIVINARQLRDVSDDALRALEAANTPPMLFVRGGELARITVDEQDKARIERLNEFSLRGLLARAADFVRLTDKGDETSVSPPLDVVRDLLTLGTWPFPGLAGLIEAPALRPDGTVITEPGYDRATGIFYRPTAALRVPPIPHHPTRAEVDDALALLREPFCDFPYVDEADRTNALALLLTPLLRPAIAGPVPLALVGATQQGTGKGLHAEMVAIVATGRGAVMSPMTRSDDEMQKQLYANLLAGEAVIVFDNVDGRIYSPALARALTASEFGGRILGESRAPGLPQRATWIATGNALQLGGDMARRCYPINLDAKMSQPWQRTGFRHPNLLEWVREQRGALIAAALTLARGWYAAGKPPPQSPIIGGFESWCRWVGGILAFAGARDFLGNLRAMYETADEESRQWESFILSLAEKFSRPATVADVCRAIEQDKTLQEVVPDIGEEPLGANGAIRPKFKQMLGLAFRRRIGRRHGDTQARIERATQSRVAEWAFKHD